MLKNYGIGNCNLGVNLVLRNPLGKRNIQRRYIRVIFKLCGYRVMLEVKFRNSI